MFFRGLSFGFSARWFHTLWSSGKFSQISLWAKPTVKALAPFSTHISCRFLLSVFGSHWDLPPAPGRRRFFFSSNRSGAPLRTHLEPWSISFPPAVGSVRWVSGSFWKTKQTIAMKNKKPKTPEPFFASKKASVMRELRVDPNFQSWSPATSGAKCHEAKNVMMIWSSLRFNLCYKNNDGAVGQRRSTQRKIQLRKNEPTQHPKGQRCEWIALQNTDRHFSTDARSVRTMATQEPLELLLGFSLSPLCSSNRKMRQMTSQTK